MLQKIQLRHILLAIVVAGGAFWLLNAKILNVTSGCSSDLARPCYMQEGSNNLQAKADANKKQKMDKENGEKEFSSCINNFSNHRGIEKEHTKICATEVVRYCEDKEWKIKKYEGKCDNTPPPPPVVSTTPKTLSYSVTKLPMPTPPIVHARRTIGGQSQLPDEVMHVRVSAASTNEQPVTIAFNALAMEIPFNLYSPDGISCGYLYVNGVLQTGTVSNLSINNVVAQGDIGGPGLLGVCQFSQAWWSDPIMPGTSKDYTLAVDSMAIPTANPKTFYLDVSPVPVNGLAGYAYENSSLPYAYQGSAGNIVNLSSLRSDSIQIVFQ